MAISIKAPLSNEAARALRAGDSCLISGVIYTARDAAHKRLCELIAKGEPLPFDVKDNIIYFVGPTPAKPGQAMVLPDLQLLTVWMHIAPFLSSRDLQV